MCELAKRGHPYGDSRPSNPLRIVCGVPCRSRLTFGRRLHTETCEIGREANLCASWREISIRPYCMANLMAW